MALINLNLIKEQLREELSPRRYIHSLAVARLSKKLANLNNIDAELAERTGLVHDVAKEWAPQALLRYVKKHQLKIPNLDFIWNVSPNLLHAYVGAHVALKKKWVNAHSACAISAHTLADLRMSDMAKLTYVADFSSYDRPYRHAKKCRQLAKENLHKAFLYALKIKIQFSLKKFKPIHPYSILVWNHFNDR